MVQHAAVRDTGGPSGLWAKHPAGGHLSHSAPRQMLARGARQMKVKHEAVQGAAPQAFGGTHVDKRRRSLCHGCAAILVVQCLPPQLWGYMGPAACIGLG